MQVVQKPGALIYGINVVPDKNQLTNDLMSVSKMFIRNGKITGDIATSVRAETQTLVSNITNKPLMKGLISNLFKLDPTLENHITGVCILATALGYNFTCEEQLLELAEGAIYHDVGKLKIPHEILSKTSKLTDEEFNIVKFHPEGGHQELTNCIRMGMPIYPTSPLVALEHHEKYDGTGYPFKKRGDAENDNTMGIHLYSRIVAIADICSALLMRRSYKAPNSIQQIITIMDLCSLDPVIYDEFREVLLRSM